MDLNIRKHKQANLTWNIRGDSFDDAKMVLLLDIRDELKILNNVFRCENALAVPGLLRAIRDRLTLVEAHTRKRRRKAKPRA